MYYLQCKRQQRYLIIRQGYRLNRMFKVSQNIGEVAFQGFGRFDQGKMTHFS